MKQIIRPMPAKPGSNAPLAEKAKWLLMTHGYDARANKVVILYEASAHCGMTLEAFKTLYMSWWEEEPRQSGKPVRVFATSVWLLHERRIEIAGTRMRPDKPFPAYSDGNEVFKNTYRQPVHIDDGTGEVDTFLTFMAVFMPDEIDRNWLLDHMAHKLLKPWIPGCGIFFVADADGGPLEGKFGTGRGMLARIAAKLYGEDYCRAEDFDILTGTSAQAVYTDWQANSVLITVDEAHSSPTAYRRGEKRSVYTALKNCIDPAPKRRSFKIKGGQAYDGLSFNTVWVFTNHANAAAIPAHDRRITVLRNGRPMTPAEAIALDAWMENPNNIAALAAYLESSDLSQFNMFEPLKTAAKDDMADMSHNAVEEALIDFASDDERGLVFPRLFLEREMEAQMTGDGERMGPRDNAWRGQLAGAFDEHCAKVKLPSGGKARIAVSKRRYTLYCFRSRAAAAALLNETERREHAAKWGSIDDIQTMLREVKGGGPGTR